MNRSSMKLSTLLFLTLLAWGALWIMSIGVALHWEFPQ